MLKLLVLTMFVPDDETPFSFAWYVVIFEVVEMQSKLPVEIMAPEGLFGSLLI